MNPLVSFFDLSFWQNVVSNALATLAGVAAGIPVALLINRWLERSSEREHKDKILRLLTVELLMNIHAINEWRGRSEDTLSKCTTLAVLLQTVHWDAFSDGGELQWIKDPDLLSQIAEAYNFVRMLLVLVEKHFQLLQISRFDRAHEAFQNAEVLLMTGIPNAESAISHALNSIAKARQPLKGSNKREIKATKEKPPVSEE